MSDFTVIQNQLKNTKTARRNAEKTAFLAKEKLAKLERKEQSVLRSNSSNSEIYQALKGEQKRTGGLIADAAGNLAASLKSELDLLRRFDPFCDPRENIGQFSDDCPVMLFPVRLETRFKKVRDKRGNFLHQLWVRIFPDDCLIDTFEEILSETEIKKIRNYWLSIWAVGSSVDAGLVSFVENQKKGAWKGLTGNLQAGRAYWMTKNYLPKNVADLPERTNKEEIILVIASEEGVISENEQNALKSYWKDNYLASEDAIKAQIALDNLKVALNNDETRALTLIEEFIPFNFNESKPTADNPLLVQVQFVIFPTKTETKLSAWTQAARVTALPEKFVLQGFKGIDGNGNPFRVLNEIGAAIPDPLIVGPNPSLDRDAALKEKLITDFNNLESDLKKEEKLTDFYDNSKDAVHKEQTEAAFIASFQVLSDEEKVVQLGEIFENLKDEVKAALFIDFLCQNSETKWLFDFEEAVKMGMGFKVNLSPVVYENGFDRLFVIGVKMRTDKEEGKTTLENLLQHHHYGTSGFSILPQGTPTNNTEDEDSGFSENEDAEETYKRYILENAEADSDDNFSKKDGRWLAELLGIDAETSSLKKTANYNQTDQCEAKAMNVALWNATIGYFMESMLSPVFSEGDEQLAFHFFTNYVSGRGNIPAIRIGNQPYGILATAPIKHLKWGNRNEFSEAVDFREVNFQKMYDFFLKVCIDWKQFSGKIAQVGKEGDAHQILLDVLGLHASSVEFHQRYAESFAHLFNQMNLSGLGGLIIRIIIEGAYKIGGKELLEKLGYQTNEKDGLVPILEKFFLTKANLIHPDANRKAAEEETTPKDALIDDQPLSETHPIRPYTVEDDPVDSKNYIYWLIEHALADQDAIKKQEGFGGKAPTALLYLFLRNALTQEFSNTALQLHHQAEILSTTEVQQAKIDTDFIGVEVAKTGFQSKYDYLDRKDARITNNQELTVSKHISNLLRNGIFANQNHRLSKIIKALNHLKDVPTARLERAFVEHLDCCSYRLDAWLLGFVNSRLEAMRRPQTIESVPQPSQGIYLGAYGWVENLQPDEEVLQSARITNEQKTIFNPDNEFDIVTDNNNGGYIHAPSLNQAVTAAVLRNAYISEAAAENPDSYKINLSSERVRMALEIIQGMQQGQSLGALLGYQMERGLHDRHDEAEVDVYIYELRKAFPLVSNQMTETAEVETDLNSITQIEARNVVDGLKLLNYIKSVKNESYPFGRTDIVNVDTEAQRIVINSEVQRLKNIRDAVADLALAEGVHHAVQANYERASGTLDTYSRGSFPQTPEVTRTPRSGTGLTHRIGIHFETGLPFDPMALPRVMAEPAVNHFLVEFLPPLSDVYCKVSFPELNDPTKNPEIRLSDLGLSPLDLLYLINVESDKSLTALDEYILKWVHEIWMEQAANMDIRLDEKITINYTEPIVGKITIFEIMPLIKSLRSLLLEARPLKSSDVSLPNEVSETTDSQYFVNIARINAAFNKFKDNFENDTPADGLDLMSHAILAHFDEEDFEKTILNQTLIINEIDDYMEQFIIRLRNLSQFGIQQAGFGFVYARKAAIISAIREKVTEYFTRWQDKDSQFTILIAEAVASTNPAEQIEILQKAERTISISYTIPVPDATAVGVTSYQGELAIKKGQFDTKLGEIQTWLNTNFKNLKLLVDAVNTLINAGSQPLSDFDLLTIEIEKDERQIIVLAEDLKIQSTALNNVLQQKAIAIQNDLNNHNNTATATKKVKFLTQAAQQLFGEEFKIIPEFELSLVQAAELQNSFNDTAQLLDYQMNTLDCDFPVDDWLYSIARVRKRMGNLESVLLFSENFKNIEHDLIPIQLPYQPNDSWVALAFPDTAIIDNDKLLYTTAQSNFDPTKSRQCGLLLDEWTEVIPAKRETTGLSFQYDQPNAEPPQAMLLVTPSEFTGNWSWDDIIDSLHETLDLAILRAMEPKHFDNSAYVQFLPATVSSVTHYPLLTIGINYALNNGFVANSEQEN